MSDWRTSSFSGSNGCVQVGFQPGRVLLRDSKRPAGPVVEFTRREWQAFIDGCKDGEFDLPPLRDHA